MRKAIITLAVLYLIFLSGGMVYAQAVEKQMPITDDLRLTVGYRLWLNDWQTGFVFAGAPRAETVTVNANAPGHIPSLSLRYKNLFVSTSLMFTPDYFFRRFTTADGVNHKFKASRMEVDVNAGYFIHPWIALTAGYKGVLQDYDQREPTRSRSETD